jgi:response regulator RpfG family c-di-GMP phosphodiesterase
LVPAGGAFSFAAACLVRAGNSHLDTWLDALPIAPSRRWLARRRLVVRTATHAHAATESATPAENEQPGSAAWVAAALEAALRARAPGVHASTPMVRQLAVRVSRELGLDAQTETLLELSVRVRDVGMISLPDSVVMATTPLSPADWELMNRTPRHRSAAARRALCRSLRRANRTSTS